MVKNLAASDRIRTMAEHATLWKDEASWFAGVARLSFAPALGQVATKLLDLAVFRIDVAVNRLVADSRPVTFVTQTSGDLFWRPPVLQPLDHGEAQIIMPVQFAPPRPTRCGQTLRIHVISPTRVVQVKS